MKVQFSSTIACMAFSFDFTDASDKYDLSVPLLMESRAF